MTASDAPGDRAPEGTIRFKCKCGKVYIVKETSAGKTATCKHCGAMVTVPMPAGSEPLAAPQTPPEVPFVPDEAFRPATAQCPFCGEVIPARANKCKHCGEALASNFFADGTGRKTKAESARGIFQWMTVHKMLVLGAIICAAFVCVVGWYVSGYVSGQTKLRLKQEEKDLSAWKVAYESATSSFYPGVFPSTLIPSLMTKNPDGSYVFLFSNLNEPHTAAANAKFVWGPHTVWEVALERQGKAMKAVSSHAAGKSEEKYDKLFGPYLQTAPPSGKGDVPVKPVSTP